MDTPWMSRLAVNWGCEVKGKLLELAPWLQLAFTITFAHRFVVRGGLFHGLAPSPQTGVGIQGRHLSSRRRMGCQVEVRITLVASRTTPTNHAPHDE